MQARAQSASRLKPVVATLVGIPAVVIILAAVNGTSAPLVGDGTTALVALWILGSAMCALGISAMRERFGIGRANVAGMPLGLLATAFVLSGLFGWAQLLTPIVDALGGPGSASLARAAIVGGGHRDGRQVGDRLAFVPSTPNGVRDVAALYTGPAGTASKPVGCDRE